MKGNYKEMCSIKIQIKMLETRVKWPKHKSWLELIVAEYLFSEAS